MTPGTTVKIGGREYVVLGQGTDTTAIIAKKFVTTMKFDSNSGNYATSEVRKYLNGEFYNELANAVGPKSVPQSVSNHQSPHGLCT